MVSVFLLRIPWINLTSFVELAYRVAGLVYDETGGDPAHRPIEFL